MQGMVTTMRFLLDLIGPEDEDECEEDDSNDCTDFENALDEDLAGDYEYE